MWHSTRSEIPFTIKNLGAIIFQRDQLPISLEINKQRGSFSWSSRLKDKAQMLSASHHKEQRAPSESKMSTCMLLKILFPFVSRKRRKMKMKTLVLIMMSIKNRKHTKLKKDSL
jgi:hypothetical protein